VTLAVRNLEAGRKVADEIAEKLPSGAAAPRVAPLDLADLAMLRHNDCRGETTTSSLVVISNNNREVGCTP
jgi:hypothetical protein